MSRRRAHVATFFAKLGRYTGCESGKMREPLPNEPVQVSMVMTLQARLRRQFSAAIGGAVLLGLASLGATQSAAPPQPCSEAPEHRAFDFWLGEWEVSLASGQVVGKNIISKDAAGCALIERWLSTSGSSGISLNYYDVADDAWVQIWTGSGGSQIDIRGGLEDASMVLVGHIAYAGQGAGKTRFRGKWTPLDDGRVRQFFEQFSTETNQWEPWFEGFYRRMDTAVLEEDSE